MKFPLVIASVAALAATAAGAARASTPKITVFEYGTCVTHLIQLLGPQAVSQVTTSIGPEAVVVLPTGQQLTIVPSGRAAQGGLQACPIGS